MTSAPKSSAAGFVDLINDAYREIMKAESGALPHALRCGDYLNRASVVAPTSRFPWRTSIPLYRPISNGGPEAMPWDLQRMELGDWHPREIPTVCSRAPLSRNNKLSLCLRSSNGICGF